MRFPWLNHSWIEFEFTLQIRKNITVLYHLRRNWKL
jgi:hypothetical protein